MTDRDRAAAMVVVESAVTELLRSSRTWTKQLAEQLDPGLPPLTFAILRHVMAHGPLRSAELVAAFGMDKGAVSRQITVLREAGLLEIAPDPDDGRATLLHASPAATGAVETFAAGIREQYARVLDAWSVAELAELGRLLSRFNDALDEGVAEGVADAAADGNGPVDSQR